MTATRVMLGVVFAWIGTSWFVMGQALEADDVVLAKAGDKVTQTHTDKRPKLKADDDRLPDVSLSVQPQRCVTLRRGQRCYLKLKMAWSSKEPISACFYSESHDAGACWENALRGELKREVYLLDSTEWILQDTRGRTLGDVTVEVSSNYNRKRRSWRGWRLF